MIKNSSRHKRVKLELLAIKPFESSARISSELIVDIKIKAEVHSKSSNPLFGLKTWTEVCKVKVRLMLSFSD